MRASDGTLVDMDAVFTIGIEREGSGANWLIVGYLVPEHHGVSYRPATILHDGRTRDEADARLTDLFLHLGRRRFDLINRSEAGLQRAPLDERTRPE